MARVGTSFASAVGQHIWLLLTLRHDGRGLPAKSSALVFTSMLLAFTMSGLQLATSTQVEDPAAMWVFGGVWLVLVYVFVAVPLKMVEVFVGSLFLQLLKQVIYLLSMGLPEQLVQPAMLPLECWFMFAILSLLHRHTERVRAPKNQSKSDEKQ